MFHQLVELVSERAETAGLHKKKNGKIQLQLSKKVGVTSYPHY